MQISYAIKDIQKKKESKTKKKYRRNKKINTIQEKKHKYLQSDSHF